MDKSIAPPGVRPCQTWTSAVQQTKRNFKQKAAKKTSSMLFLAQQSPTGMFNNTAVDSFEQEKCVEIKVEYEIYVRPFFLSSQECCTFDHFRDGGQR